VEETSPVRLQGESRKLIVGRSVWSVPIQQIDPSAVLRERHVHVLRRIVGIHLRDYRNGQQVPLGQGTFPLAQSSATLKQLDWRGWLLNEEEREDGTKAGLKFIEPAFKAMQAAFSG
jgi:sugar phosphate isomerase/epimerase